MEQHFERQSSNYEFTNVVLNQELKDLVYREMIYAQDVEGPAYLGKLSTYEMYHSELQKLFKKIYNKTPTQTDNLAFILLLTYPKEMVEKLETFKDLKLAFNDNTKESDFEDKSFVEDETMTSTCICNERIRWVHIFMNKYSGISIQLGSHCNDRYGLISKYDERYKSTCHKIKQYKEKNKERQEGKPEGFYENERKIKKEEKEEKKRIKQEIKLMKAEEERTKRIQKEIQKEIEQLNKRYDNFYTLSKCNYCKNEIIYNKRLHKICICSKCCSNEHKEFKAKLCNLIKLSRNDFCVNICVWLFVLNNHIKELKKEINSKVKTTVEIGDCCYCENEFISINNARLCWKCKKTVKICKCVLCLEKFCVGHHNKNDNYCDVCEDKIIKCIECSSIVYKDTSKKQTGRCDDCYRRFVNKLILIKCKYCGVNLEVQENEKWRSACKNCYKNNLTTTTCTGCNVIFSRLPHEIWRKTCRDCYKSTFLKG